MKKTMRFFIIIGLFFAMPVMANTFTTPIAAPTNLHIYGNSENVYVDLISHGCSGSRYYLKAGHHRFDQIFSMLLAAQLAERMIALRVKDCNVNKQGEIIGVYLK